MNKQEFNLFIKWCKDRYNQKTLVDILGVDPNEKTQYTNIKINRSPRLKNFNKDSYDQSSCK